MALTTVDVRHRACEIAEKENINHCFSKSKKLGEVDWLKGFLNRHLNMSIRAPIVTNVSCAVTFNKESDSAQNLFEVYK